jgi:SAM-dependent methyltransferase
MAGRDQSIIGIATVRAWGRTLPAGASVLDLGCGSDVPLSLALMNEGLLVHGVDASPNMVAAFCSRFPGTPVACEAVESSRFFDRTFDGVHVWGLMFLLSADAQRDLIRRVARVLRPDGRFLFTSPKQSCTWTDLLTGRQSLSLGAVTYEAVLSEAGLATIGEHTDEGDNHYFEAAKR